MGNPAVKPRFLAPGDKLGKFDLIRQIAVGGMAELYLARTMGIEGFEKLVVVKRILPQYVDNPTFVNMFLNEARLSATLHHPHIAQVYDIGVEEGDYFFSMEYIHGEDLGRLLASASENGVPISLDAALTLGAHLCAGLHYAHEKAGPDGKPLNVVHRDVSPSNVLVSYDGAVKLVDFGIARAGSAPATTRGGLKGKIAYMSPEQCKGKQVLDRRSDVFSVGSLMFELTTGQLPFTDETEYGVLNQIVNTDAPSPLSIVPSYPPALAAIITKALARDPDARYATALELQRDLEDFAHENRLRVSPLVLSRLMSSVFPTRLEEWDHARAQGAFFVEQHVVRTLIESGKTSAGMAVPSLPTDVAAAAEPGAPVEQVRPEDETTDVIALRSLDTAVGPLPMPAINVSYQPRAPTNPPVEPENPFEASETIERKPIAKKAPIPERKQPAPAVTQTIRGNAPQAAPPARPTPPPTRPRLPGMPRTPPVGVAVSPFADNAATTPAQRNPFAPDAAATTPHQRSPFAPDTSATTPEQASPFAQDASPFAPDASPFAPDPTTSTFPGTGSAPHRPSPMPLPAPRPTPMPGQLQAEAARLATPDALAGGTLAGGTLVSNGGPGDLAAPLPITGTATDVTERVRVPTPIPARDDTAFVRPPRSKLPLFIGLGVAVAGAVIAIVVIGGSGGSSSANTSADTSGHATPVDKPPPAPPADRPAAVAPPDKAATNDPVDETPEPVEKDPADKPVADKPVADKPDKPVPDVKSAVVAKKPPPVVVKTPPQVVKSPGKRPPPKTDPKKEPTWNADSPFMPVRTDKK